jgi:hypothetical protein
MTAAYCSTCWETGPVVPSLRNPDEQVCQTCRDYEKQWAAMTPAERRADHDAAIAHCEQTKEY